MAQYNVLMKQLNNTKTAWDELRPLTISGNVTDNYGGSTKRFVTPELLTWLTKVSAGISGDGSGLILGTDLSGNFTHSLKELKNIRLTDYLEFYNGAAKKASIHYDNPGNALTFNIDAVDLFKIKNDGSILVTAENKPIRMGESYAPSNNKDVTTKDYVDNIALGVKPTGPAKVRTTTDIALTGVNEIDGVTINTPGERVLLVAQVTPGQNGIYSWSSTNGGTLTKVSPAANDNVNHSLVSITEGTTGAGERWYCLNYVQGLWIQFDSQIDIQAGAGISVSGATVSIKSEGVTNAMLAGSINAGKLKLGSALESASGDLNVKASGITDAMLAGSILRSKLLNSLIVDDIGWADLTIPNPSTTDPLKDLLQHQLSSMASAIKLLRGTANYNTNNSQTIAGLYTGKNKITISAIEDPDTADRTAGDLHFYYEE